MNTMMPERGIVPNGAIGTRVPQVAMSLDYLEKALAELGALHTQLEGRLSPVMTPMDANVSAGAPDFSVGLAMRVAELIRITNGQITLVRGILDSLEI